MKASISCLSNWLPFNSRLSDNCICATALDDESFPVGASSSPFPLPSALIVASSSGIGGQFDIIDDVDDEDSEEPPPVAVFIESFPSERLSPLMLLLLMKEPPNEPPTTSKLLMPISRLRSVLTSCHFEVSNTIANSEQPKDTHFHD